MAEMKATPRPWRVQGDYVTAASTGFVIASTRCSRFEPEDDTANARLIVQAVNAYDALVDALEAASDELDHIILAHGLNLDPDVLEEIDAALVLAKQEAQSEERPTKQ